MQQSGGLLRATARRSASLFCDITHQKLSNLPNNFAQNESPPLMREVARRAGGREDERVQ